MQINASKYGNCADTGSLCFFSFNKLACKHNLLYSLTYSQPTNPSEKKTLQLMTLNRPFPETRAIARARANTAQNKFTRAFFCPRSFSNQCSHLIARLSFPMFELLTVKYQDVSK